MIERNLASFSDLYIIISLSSGPLNFIHISSMKKKIRKKLRYFRFPPNLAHRKLIDLANDVPSSSPRGVLSFTQRFAARVVETQ